MAPQNYYNRVLAAVRRARERLETYAGDMYTTTVEPLILDPSPASLASEQTDLREENDTAMLDFAVSEPSVRMSHLEDGVQQRADIVELLEKNQRLEKELQEESTILNAMREDNEKIKKELSDLKEMREDNDKIKQELSDLKSEKVAIEHRLQQELHKECTILKEMKEGSEDIKEELSNLKNEKAASELRSQKELQKERSTLKAVREENEKIKGKLSDLQNKKVASKLSLQKKLQCEHNCLKALLKENQKINNKHFNLKKEKESIVIRLQKELQKERNILKEMKEENQNIKKELSKLKKEKDTMEEEHFCCMEAVIQENEELTIEVSELNARMAVLTGDNQRSDEELQEECGSLKAERDENQSDDDLSDFKNEMKDIEQEVILTSLKCNLELAETVSSATAEDKEEQKKEEVAEAGPFEVPSEAPLSPNSHFDGVPSPLRCSPKKSLQTKCLAIIDEEEEEDEKEEDIEPVVEDVENEDDTAEIVPDCVAPSERKIIDIIVAYAWEEANKIGFKNIQSISSPGALLLLTSNDEELYPAEVELRDARVELVFQLAKETIELMHPPKECPPVWARECTTPGLLVPRQFPDYQSPTLQDVQKRVYAALTEGQNPTHLRNLKFLHSNKRPGGKEIDFIDQMLILEMRKEEPEWVDYSKDKQMVKEKVADDLFEALLSETVTVMKNIAAKKATRNLTKM